MGDAGARGVGWNAAVAGEGQALSAAAAFHRLERLGDVVTAAATAAARLGAPCYLAALLRDAATNRWHVAAILDSAARPLDLSALGVPQVPFLWMPPLTEQHRPLAALLGEGWGQARCARIERQLGSTAALALPIAGAGGPRGALLALFDGGVSVPLVQGLLAHAALAAARALDGLSRAPNTGLLDSGSLSERADQEISRALRYGRPLTVVICLPGDSADAGARALPRLRTWDFAGRAPFPYKGLVFVLPETGRPSALGLLRRLSRQVPEALTGVAILPDDGDRLITLIEVAQTRAVTAAQSRQPDDRLPRTVSPVGRPGAGGSGGLLGRLRRA